MEVKLVTATFTVWALMVSGTQAQDLNAEVSITGGASTDGVVATAAQGRIFGDVHAIRVYAEGAWTRSTERADGRESEAFATAYPYDGPPRLMDAYLERRVGGGRVFTTIRGGRLRTPFGIYDASDHAYNGFLRAPLIRYEGYWSVTNTLFEHGVNVMAGTSWLQGEVTVGSASDVGDHLRRRAGPNTVARAQTYYRGAVIGVSHVRSQSYDVSYATGKMTFTGVDARWMHGGVQLRGEWLIGRPWDGTRTVGAYVDVIVHRPAMGPLTLVGRLETLDYDTGYGMYDDAASGLALGARLKLTEGLHAQMNVTHRPDAPYGQNVTATDVALTYTVRVPR